MSTKISVNRIEREELENVQTQNPNSMKAQLFTEFAELTPDGEAIEVEFNEDKQMNYIRSLASKYNREEAAEDIKLRTKVDKQKKKAYVYATNMS